MSSFGAIPRSRDWTRPRSPPEFRGVEIPQYDHSQLTRATTGCVHIMSQIYLFEYMAASRNLMKGINVNSNLFESFVNITIATLNRDRKGECVII